MAGVASLGGDKQLRTPMSWTADGRGFSSGAPFRPLSDNAAANNVTAAQADPQSLASGILTALTTTAAGLAIALLAYFVSGWLEARIEAERQAMEVSISAAIHGRPTRSRPLAG